MFRRFSFIIFTLLLMMLCLWSDAPQAVHHHEILMPEHEDSPIKVILTIRSLFPPKEICPFEVDGTCLVAAYRAPVQLAKITVEGPLWTQTCLLFPATLQDIPEQEITLNNGYSFTLPELHPTSVGIPSAPIAFQNASDIPAPPPNALQTIAAFIGIILLTIVFRKLLRNLKHPPMSLQTLPPTRESLDAIPALLAEKDITPKSHPEFFQKLNIARFAPTSPEKHVIKELIHTASTL